MTKTEYFLFRISISLPEDLLSIFQNKKGSKADIIRHALTFYHDIQSVEGCLLSGKEGRKRLRRYRNSFATMMEIHEYAKTHSAYEEPVWVRKIFEQLGNWKNCFAGCILGKIHKFNL